MAEEIKYISENGKLYLEETKQIYNSLCNKLEELGANRVKAYSEFSKEVEYHGMFEFPRQGSVLFHFQEHADKPTWKWPESFKYNVKVNLLGFREDTKKYQKVKSSIEDILESESFNKVE